MCIEPCPPPWYSCHCRPRALAWTAVGWSLGMYRACTCANSNPQAGPPGVMHASRGIAAPHGLQRWYAGHVDGTDTVVGPSTTPSPRLAEAAAVSAASVVGLSASICAWGRHDSVLGLARAGGSADVNMWGRVEVRLRPEGRGRRALGHRVGHPRYAEWTAMPQAFSQIFLTGP